MSSDPSVGGGVKRTRIEEVPEPPTPEVIPEGSSVIIIGSGERFTLSNKAAAMSSVMKTVILGTGGGSGEEGGSDSEDEEMSVEIPMRNFTDPAIMGDVVRYLMYHTDTPTTKIPKRVTTNDMSTIVTDAFDLAIVSPREGESVSKLITRCCDMIKVADRMDIDPLFKLLAAFFATRMWNRDERASMINMGLDPDAPENQFTEEDKAQLLKEFPELARQ